MFEPCITPNMPTLPDLQLHKQPGSGTSENVVYELNVTICLDWKLGSDLFLESIALALRTFLIKFPVWHLWFS